MRCERCGISCLDAEDYRDHLPCPGSLKERQAARIAALEDALRSVCGAFQNFREIVNINGKNPDALLFGINATDKALELLRREVNDE